MSISKLRILCAKQKHMYLYGESIFVAESTQHRRDMRLHMTSFKLFFKWAMLGTSSKAFLIVMRPLYPYITHTTFEYLFDEGWSNVDALFIFKRPHNVV